MGKRVEALENAIATKGTGSVRKGWRNVVGMVRNSEFMRDVDEECLRLREAEREAARHEKSAEWSSLTRITLRATQAGE